MRIAIFHNLPKGGAKRYLFEVARTLSINNKIDEYTISTHGNYLSLQKFVDNTFIYKYHAGNNILEFVFRALFILPSIHKKIANEIDGRKYDFILANHDYITKSPYLLRFAKTKSLYICHEPQREYHERNDKLSPGLTNKISNLIRTPIKYIDIKNGRSCTVLIANSEYSKHVLNMIYNKDSIRVYPGVLPPPNINDSPIYRRSIVLSIGGLSPVKGHEFEIRSLSLIPDNIRPNLIIIGDGRFQDKKSLVQLAIESKVKLKIIDYASDSELFNYYNKASLLLCAAYGEPFGLTILEAMAHGTVPVVIRDGGVGEQLEKGGGIISRRNINEYAAKIIDALNNWQALSEEAKQLSKLWNWRNTASQLLTIARNLK